MRSLLSLKRLWILLALPAAILLLLAAGNPDFAEWYALHPYAFLSRVGNAVTGIFPFSLAEILVILLLIGVPVALIWFLIHFFRSKGRRGVVLGKGLLNLLCFASVLLLLFTLNCGINYNRHTFAETCGLELRPSSTKELTDLSHHLAEKLNELRPLVKEDENGMMISSFSSLQEQGAAAREAFNTLHEECPLLSPGYSDPKAVMNSRVMSWFHITGVYFPFTFEANVNVDVPAYSIPATMCHELSHLRGFMREDEANFIGYLACCRSSSPDFQYSGYMLAFVYANNALYSADSEAASAVYSELSEGVQRDYAANTTYWKQFEGPMKEISNSVNNTYLKANGQEDGVKSYGRMVDLLLAEYRSQTE